MKLDFEMRGRLNALAEDYYDDAEELAARAYETALKHDPVVKQMAKVLEFYSQPRTQRGKAVEIKHESDYEFYPNHDVALEALQKYKAAIGGERATT